MIDYCCTSVLVASSVVYCAVVYLTIVLRVHSMNFYDIFWLSSCYQCGESILVFWIHQFTLPETNGSPLKMDGWNTILSYWVSAYFQGLCHVSFREGIWFDFVVRSSWRCSLCCSIMTPWLHAVFMPWKNATRNGVVWPVTRFEKDSRRGQKLAQRANRASESSGFSNGFPC